MAQSKQMNNTPLRIPPELKDWAKAQAASSYCSLNAWIIGLMLEEKQRQKKTVKKMTA